VKQTYSNLEILCIDDGSCDKSADICEEYSSNDRRIKVIRKDISGGSGTPVNSLNIGLKIYTGQYVGFVDPDDWIEPDMYEALYETVKRKKTSVGIANFFWDDGINSIAERNDTDIPDEVLTAKDLLLYTFHRDKYKSFYFSNWNKLYSAEHIKKNNELKFSTIYTFANDILFNFAVYMTEGCTGAYYNEPLYHFCQRSESITHNPSFKMKNDNLLVWELIINTLNDKGFSDISIWVKKIHAYHSCLYAESALEACDSNVFSHFQKKMKLYSDIYIKENKDYPERIEWFSSLLGTM